VVAGVRSTYDVAAAYGVPAHVTVLFPFLPLADVDSAVRAELARICAAVPAFDVVLPTVRRFPGVAWLDPTPAGPFRVLTSSVAARWPDHQPYGGVFTRVVPHLTVAEGDDDVLDEAERLVTPGLPIGHRVDRMDLIGFGGSRWERVATFAFEAVG
jgi:2'-5' RNA ligase